MKNLFTQTLKTWFIIFNIIGVDTPPLPQVQKMIHNLLTMKASK